MNFTVWTPRASLMDIILYLHFWLMLGGDGRSRGHRRASRSFRVEMLPTSSTIMLGGARPSLSDPARAMAPHRSRLLTATSISPAAALTLQAGLALAASHGRQVKRAAAVNRPARLNAHKEHSAGVTDRASVMQASYPLEAEVVLCLL
jgi:hypothetical protein